MVNKNRKVVRLFLNQTSNTMRTISKTLMLIGIIGAALSCKSTFNATEAMESQNNREAVYQEIISNPGQMNEFIELAQQDDQARRIMMQSHMQMMESGKMKETMKNNPDMKKKMMPHMQKMMEENLEMMEEMMDKMMDNPERMKKMMKKMQEKGMMEKKPMM